MRTVIFIYLILFFQNSFAQEKTYSLTAVDTAPVITTCKHSKDTKECFTYMLIDHIKRNIDVSKTHNDPGRAYVQFVISSTGEIQDIKVRAESANQIKEAKRVLSGLKIKKPATLDGENVAIIHSVPVVFQTQIYNSHEDYLKTQIKEVQRVLNEEKPKNAKN